MARIVVGVDGSESSAQALRWAVDEARRRDATLEVVMTWEYPALYATASHAVMLPPEVASRRVPSPSADLMPPPLV